LTTPPINVTKEKGAPTSEKLGIGIFASLRKVENGESEPVEKGIETGLRV